MRDVARQLAEAGQPDEALALLPELSEPVDRANVQVEIVKALASARRVDEVVAVARKIESDHARMSALGTATAMLDKAGRKEEATATLDVARAIANKLMPERSRAQAFARLSARLAASGLVVSHWRC